MRWSIVTEICSLQPERLFSFRKVNFEFSLKLGQFIFNSKNGWNRATFASLPLQELSQGSVLRLEEQLCSSKLCLICFSSSGKVSVQGFNHLKVQRQGLEGLSAAVGCTVYFFICNPGLAILIQHIMMLVCHCCMTFEQRTEYLQIY